VVRNSNPKQQCEVRKKKKKKKIKEQKNKKEKKKKTSTRTKFACQPRETPSEFLNGIRKAREPTCHRSVSCVRSFEAQVVHLFAHTMTMST